MTNQQVQEDIWDCDEFEDSEEENPMYSLPEEPHSGWGGGGRGGGGGQDSREDEDYKTLPSRNKEDMPRAFRLAKPLRNDDYLDGGTAGGPPRPSQRRPTHATPPTLPRTDAAPQRQWPKVGQFNTLHPLPPAPPGAAVPQVDRSKKASLARTLKAVHPVSGEGAPAGSQHPGVSLPAQTKKKPPEPPDKRAALSKSVRGPPAPPSSQKTPFTPAGPKTDMDPRWYGGQMSRQQAELVLRKVNKDGAFLVRDSSRGLSEQPYTLMMLFGGHVYNIQIRQQGGQYSLGKSLNSFKSLPTVSDIISQHAQTPLKLISTKEQDSGATRQSCLLYPAAR